MINVSVSRARASGLSINLIAIVKELGSSRFLHEDEHVWKGRSQYSDEVISVI